MDIHEFYNDYYIHNRPKTDILQKYKISEVTYQHYINECKTLKFDISTDFLERELMINYKISKDDEEKRMILKTMIDIWKVKHKVPNESADDDIQLDLSKLKVQIPSAPSP